MNRRLLTLTIITLALPASAAARAPSPPSPSAVVRQMPPRGSLAADTRLDWRVSATDHFDITCTPELAERVESLGRRAERAYRQLAANLRHDLSHPARVVTVRGGSCFRCAPARRRTRWMHFFRRWACPRTISIDVSTIT